MSLKSVPQEEYVQSLMTDEVYDAFLEARDKFDSSDLVITFYPNDEDENSARLVVYRRPDFVQHLRGLPGIPEKLIQSLERTASDALGAIRTLGGAFWFITDLPNDTTVCCAITATRMEQVGTC